MSSVPQIERTQTPQRSRRKGTIPKNSILALWSTTIGKKFVMAITGAVLVAFVVVHMLGNLKAFAGAADVDSYALFLRQVGMPELGYGDLLWVVRVVLVICVVLHILAAYQLTLISRAARPIGYAKKKNIHTTYSALLMRWSGVLIVAFVIFHIFHFTLGDVGFGSAGYIKLGVYHNVIAAFHIWWISLIYIVAMLALGLHIDHGVWSGCQTIGWTTPKNTIWIRNASRTLAIIVAGGFILIPVAVMTGWLH